MKSKRFEQLKRAIEIKRKQGSSTGSIVSEVAKAPSLRVARDRAHDAMEAQMKKAGKDYTPHMEKRLLEGVEQAFYNRDFHIRERDKNGY